MSWICGECGLQLRDAETRCPACDVAEIRRLKAALEQYADPKHWGINRDDLNYKVVTWIGPGATEKPLPNPMAIAREALEAEA